MALSTHDTSCHLIISCYTSQVFSCPSVSLCPEAAVGGVTAPSALGWPWLGSCCLVLSLTLCWLPLTEACCGDIFWI